jgi:glycine betaine/proline transport system permease protein
MFNEQVIPMDIWISDGVNWLVDNHRAFFLKLKWPVEQTLNALDHGLNALHPAIIIIAVLLLAWKIAGWRISLFSGLSLSFLSAYLAYGKRP